MTNRAIRIAAKSLKRMKRAAMLAALLGCCAGNASAFPGGDIPIQEPVTVDSIAAEEARQSGHKIRESIFPDGSRSLSRSHFTWGAEIGASIDMTGNNLSTFDIDAFFGYKNSWIKTAGIGAGIHRSFGNSSTFIPIYAIFRSSFTSRPSLLFFSTKLGYSFNSLPSGGTEGGFKGNMGVGINLAMSRRFQSHLILSCGYFLLDNDQALAAGLSIRNVYLAQISFGMNF